MYPNIRNHVKPSAVAGGFLRKTMVKIKIFHFGNNERRFDIKLHVL